MKMNLYNSDSQAWKQAPDCDCSLKNCNHKLCPICHQKMSYGAHESVAKQRNSSHAWNVDPKLAKSNGANNQTNDFQAVHIKCNHKLENN